MTSIISIQRTPIFLFVILIFLILPTQSFALEEGFYSTVSLSIGSVGKEGLTYSENDVVGGYTSDIVRYTNMDFLTQEGYKRRAYNHYERVAVPPFSEIDIGYYWYNNTPNTVDIETIRFPLSREIQQNGDATDILYDIGFQEGITCTSSICRGGKYLDIDGVGVLSSDMYKDPKKGVVIETIRVKPAAEITKYEIEYFDVYLSKVVIYVENNTGEYLKNIRINYKTIVDKIIDLEPYEKRTLEVYKKCVLTEDEVNCGSMKIYDNNTKGHCIVYGSSWDNYFRPDSITLFNEIDEEWISGAQTQPAVESFCIQRLPYSYRTEDMIVYIEPEEPEPTQEEYWKTLLDIDILPITSYKFSKLERYLSLLKPLGIDNLKVL